MRQSNGYSTRPRDLVRPVSGQFWPIYMVVVASVIEGSFDVKELSATEPK